MPNFVSKFGIFHPRKEKTYLPDKEEIYTGPDRAAVEMIKENGGQLGAHFRTSAEFVMRVKQLGFGSIDEYLQFMGYDEKKAEAEFNKSMNEVIKHESPKKIKARRFEGGGMDTSGQGNHMEGDFKAAPGNISPRQKE